jgi:3-phosphoshikimate 1-carboxyvinyltransferase
VTSFFYRGPIPASKSLLNRALLIQSYFPQLIIEGDSGCDDVRYMKAALESFRQKKEIHCGEAGTVLRFMALRASREPGTWKLTGSRRLFERPQQEIALMLEQLGVSCFFSATELKIQGQGWKKPSVPLQVQRSKSSQFVSSLLLNCWNLSFPLEFEMKGQSISEGYWQMSRVMAEDLGMKINQLGSYLSIPEDQRINSFRLSVEMDCSSAFAIAAAAVLVGKAEITNSLTKSLQPDFVFAEILKKMGVGHLEKTERLLPIEINLENSPDLFPILAVLCAFAEGRSRLFGAPQLALKESNRIQKTAELLGLAGFTTAVHSDGLTIDGGGANSKPRAFDFDPDQDHRMVMAATLLRLKGFPITIHQPEVVNKSFPEFWQILGIEP